jgi:hypothetical protein
MAAAPIDPLAEVAEQLRGRFAVPFVRVVDRFLDEATCDALKARITALSPALAPISAAEGMVVRTDIRNNERAVFDDVPLADALFAAARPFLPETLRGMPRTTDTDGPTWGASGLNERFRGYRYRPGQRFAPHYDGCFARNAEERSAITFLIYLDEGFVGGETRILDWSVTVAPKKGSLFVFDHYVLHEGAVVEAGEKRLATVLAVSSPPTAVPGGRAACSART